jgi:pimeloyl-ACP methyl ester carboxylesterase
LDSLQGKRHAIYGKNKIPNHTPSFQPGPVYAIIKNMKKRKKGLILTFLFMLLLGLAPAGFGAAEELPRGAPVDKVVCAADAAQSYALYLPAAYNCDRRWPIIYIFEPGARGPLAIGVFRAAAEKYGYIIVCSNNSQNGPWEPVNRALQAVWTDTQQRFCIDNERVYSAGHSGGAQVALVFGLFLKKSWAGVISCCGSLPSQIPLDSLPKDLVVFTSTGLYDFNYWPTRNIGAALDKLGVLNHLEVFLDGHTWLPGAAAMDAVSWLELQAMKKDLRPRDDGWIAAQFDGRLRRAQELEQKDKAAEAYEAYLALAADFRGLIDVAQVESSVARLNNPAAFEKHRKASQAAEQEEVLKFNQSTRALGAYLNAANSQERHRALAEIRIPALNKETKKGDDSPAGLTARRLLGYLLGRAVVAADQAYARGDMKTAMYLYELAVDIKPDSGYAWYNLACVYSRLKEIKDALRALETAVRCGVTNWAAIEKDTDFEALRQEPAYIRLLEALKKDNPAK